jgi:hypothetical protein
MLQSMYAATVPLEPAAPTSVCSRQRAAVANRRQTTGGGCKPGRCRCWPLIMVPNTGLRREEPNIPAQIIACLRRDRCRSPRQRHTIGCQAGDQRRLQRTTGGCNGRHAADDGRQRRDACAQPAADPVQLPAAPHVASRQPCLAASGVDAALRYAPAPRRSRPHPGIRVRIAPSSERALQQRQYQQHEEYGRIFEWPTSANPSPCEVQVRLDANRTADARSESLLRMAGLNSSRPPSVVAQSTKCGRSVMPSRVFAAFITAICCRSWKRSRDVERFH